MAGGRDDLATWWALFGEAVRFAAQSAQAHGVDDVMLWLTRGRLPSGTLVLDAFLAKRKGLTVTQRRVVGTWKNVVSSLWEFGVVTRKVVAARDLVTWAPAELKVPKPSLLTGHEPGRVGAVLAVPLRKGWMLGGAVQWVRPTATRADVLDVAARIACNDGPRVRLAQTDITAKFMTAEAEAFRGHFGAAFKHVPSPELTARMHGFYEAVPPPEFDGFAAIRVLAMPDHWESESTGIVCDPVDGIEFVPEMHELVAAVQARDAATVRQWLERDMVGAAVFRAVAEHHEEELSRVVGDVLAMPHFEWAKHGPELMRRTFRVAPPRPHLVPLATEVANSIDPTRDHIDGIGLSWLLG